MARFQGAVRLPPGFRFHPTDEELVVEYLKRKVFSAPLPASVIPEIQLSRFDPWDLPGGPEKERYFFSTREIKYPKGNRPNRASGAGYWKATGKDKQILAGGGGGSHVVGAKKTLVFYRGKAPSGERTDWIMHEYRLVGAGEEAHVIHLMVQMKDWVLCRVFRKRRATARVAGDEAAGHRTAGLIDFMAEERRSSFDVAAAPASDSEPSCVTEVSGAAAADGDADSSCSSPSSPPWREDEEALELS
ncbi:unnamed protein product [Spirodela intermedia]|uniref:NAC domain-containing protein n=1 Tax=Spirodela intermedia TaxID=51605 RepID=A0A7I8L598_SPIIN|nr:unnamed protein product [Spirodela intermedia]